MKTLNLLLAQAFVLLAVSLFTGCASKTVTVSADYELAECLDTDDLSAEEIEKWQAVNGCKEIIAKADAFAFFEEENKAGY